MNVAFWNGISAADSVANYVAAIGTMLAMECNCKVVLGSNYISNRMLQDCFSSKMLEDGIAHAPYCFLYGTPEYYGTLWKMKRNRQDNILEVPMEGITIIFPPDVAEKRMFYYEIPRQNFYLLDVAKGNIAASKSALDEAEIVVVFLSQDATEIQNFFKRFSSLVPKTIFVIVDYQRDVGYSCRRLESEYGIKRRNIGIIPHNTEYKEACEEGKLEFFLKHNMKQATKEQKYNFIVSLKKIAKRLYERGIFEIVKEQEDEQKL